MTSPRARTARLAFATAACVACAVLPSAAAAPSTDSQGYVDSTARCASPSTAVLYGSTDTSRVAICKTPDGRYEYRGVRVRDGAKLILPAAQSGDGYVVDNDGITYTVTAESLVISQGDNVIRKEQLVDTYRADAPAGPGPGPAPDTPTPTTPLPPPLPAEVGGNKR
ncbi:hypothetical protein [Mycobacterium sp. 3519A]|uniref:hypothetical protein n=1 Tax=Mycobacterium sp. 3519A TaxID=2057184 RepID=UPI000C7B899B|nr:hypothetical protein [Mycobacterium sp. 3519A]